MLREDLPGYSGYARKVRYKILPLVLLGAFLDGYRWSGPTGQNLARRLLRYLLLHRYAPLSWLLEQRPIPAARSFEDLAAAWMGLA